MKFIKTMGILASAMVISFVCFSMHVSADDTATKDPGGRIHGSVNDNRKKVSAAEGVGTSVNNPKATQTSIHTARVDRRNNSNHVVRKGRKIIPQGTPIRVTWRANRTFYWNILGGISELFVDGERAYCLEPSIFDVIASQHVLKVPFADVRDLRVHPDGRLRFKPTMNQQRNLELIANYGYAYPGQQTDGFEWASKKLIWNEMGWDVQGGMNVDRESAIIRQRIAAHQHKPSWNQTVKHVNKGQRVVLSEQGLEHYEINHSLSRGIENVSFLGDDLSLNVRNDDAKLVLNKKQGATRGTSFVYADGKAQKMTVLKVADPVYASIAFNINRSSLELVKHDTKHTAIRGAVFELANQQHQRIGLYTTDQKGTIRISDLEEGHYFIREHAVPAPLILDLTWRPITLKSGHHRRELFVNQAAQGIIKIIKKDHHGQRVAGVVFAITNHLNEEVATLTTDELGMATSQKLPLGTYHIVEKATGNGMVRDPRPQSVQLRYKNQSTPIVEVLQTFVNEYKRGNLIVKKVENKWDASPQHHQKPLANVLFSLVAKTDLFEGKTLIYRANQHVGEARTNDQGTLTFHNLPIGTYILKERKPARGYLLFKGQWEVTIDANQSSLAIITVERQISNQVIHGKSLLRKYDSATDARLKNAVFGLFHSDGQKIGTYTTNEDGEITSPDLRYGSYYWQELAPPLGYWPQSRKYPFAIRDHQTVVQINAPNHAIQAKLLVRKIDGETQIPLKGVGFQIIDKDGVAVTISSNLSDKVDLKSEWYTDENGKLMIEGFLPYGLYSLVESKPLQGYNPITPIFFSIDHQQHYHDLGTKGLALKIPDVTNIQIYGFLRIRKIDALTKKPIAGVRFEIYDADKNYIETLTTDQDGYAPLRKRGYGCYYVKEVSVPTPYVIDPKRASQSVWIEQEGKTYDLLFSNIKTAITILKTDKTTQKPVAGTVFKIYDHTLKLLETQTTNEEGFIKLEGYPFATYFIEEFFVASPYVFDPKHKRQTVHLSPQSPLIKLHFENRPATGALHLLKTDAKTGIGVMGGMYEVFSAKTDTIDDFKQYFKVTLDALGNVCAMTLHHKDALNQRKVGEMHSDANGKASLTNLKLGRYFIVERRAPLGYQIDQSIYEVHLKYHDATTPTINQTFHHIEKRLKIKLNVHKIDALTRERINDSALEFKLVDANGETLPPQREKDGTVSWLVDALETYTLIETHPPSGYQQATQGLKIDTFQNPNEIKRHVYFENFPLKNDTLPNTGATQAKDNWGLWLVLVGCVLCGCGALKRWRDDAAFAGK